MNGRALSLVAGLIVLATASSCSTALPTHLGREHVPRPQVVRVFIGGLFGPSYEVFSDGVKVTYTKTKGMLELENTKGETFTPDLQQWKQFRQDLDQLDVWRWQARYDRNDIVDGTSWYVIVADGPNRFIASYGGNAYPDRFDGFMAATRRLF